MWGIKNNYGWVAMGGLLVLYILFAAAETSLFALSPLDRLRLKERNRPRGELVESLLSRCGFEVRQVYSDYERSPFGSKYPGDLILLAAKV